MLRLRQAFALKEEENPLLDGELPASYVDAALSVEGREDLIPVDVWAVPLHFSNGEKAGAMGVVQETSREALYRKAIVGFQRTVGHDIRNAVSVLEGYLPLLLASSGKPEGGASHHRDAGPRLATHARHHHLDDEQRAAYRRARAVSGERFLLRELVLEAIRTLAPAAYNKDVRIESEVGEELLVRGSRDMPIAALTNLLYAAVKIRPQPQRGAHCGRGRDRRPFSSVAVPFPLQI